MRFPVQSPPRRAGFTLIEMIIVIVITGIIAAILGTFVLRPIQGYNAQIRRAELIDEAEGALRRMQRDIRAAVPNSVRIRTPVGNVGAAVCPTNNAVCVIEILHTVDGGRYRANPPGNPSTRLQFGINETDFDVIGALQNFGNYVIGGVNDAYLIINNQTTTGTQFNAYFGDNRAVLAAGTTATHINIAATNFAPALASPSQRFYIVDTPVTYLCDTTAGTLTRYQSYSINSDHSSRDTAGELTGAGATGARAANLVSACEFSYQPGTSQRAGIVTLALTIRDPDVNGQPEQVRLLHQVHVYNMP